MSIFQHIRETRESKKREKEFKKEIERIKKLDDEKIKEKHPSSLGKNRQCMIFLRNAPIVEEKC